MLTGLHAFLTTYTCIGFNNLCVLVKPEVHFTNYLLRTIRHTFEASFTQMWVNRYIWRS